MEAAKKIISELFKGYGDLFTSLNNATKGESPRAKIILYAAQIDEYLMSLLKKLLIKHRSKQEKEDELFRVYGPLSDFSARIAVAYRLGVISRDDADAFDLIRKLRNDCAHNIYEFSLDASPTREHITQFVNLSCKDPSRAFMFYVGVPNMPCPKTNEEALTYCCIFHLVYLYQTIQATVEINPNFTNDIFNISTKYPEIASDLNITWSPLDA